MFLHTRAMLVQAESRMRSGKTSRLMTPYCGVRGTLTRLRPACASVQRAQNPASLSGYNPSFLRAYLVSLPTNERNFKASSNKFEKNSTKVSYKDSVVVLLTTTTTSPERTRKGSNGCLRERQLRNAGRTAAARSRRRRVRAGVRERWSRDASRTAASRGRRRGLRARVRHLDGPDDKCRQSRNAGAARRRL